MSYFEQRIFKEMKCTAEDIRCRYVRIDDDGYRKEYEQDIFSEDPNGNIKIRVCGIDRQMIEMDNPKLEKRSTVAYTEDTKIDYVVLRLSPENFAKEKAKGIETGKYKFPPNAGVHPFFPPALLDKYEKKEHIAKLVLTEGYFKAFVASRAGIDIVGLSSITHYADSKTHKLHPDICQIIKVCGVRAVIVLHDGDCLDLSKNAVADKKDLANRPMGFFNAAIKSREVLMDEGVDIFYAHVNTEELIADEDGVRPKGLDDLILAPKYEHRTKEIIDDLTATAKSHGDFFWKFDLKGQVQQIKRHFFLDNVNNFYHAHENEIEDAEFIYLGNLYQYDKDEDVVRTLAPKALSNYYRVGDCFYFDKLMPRSDNPSILVKRRLCRNKGTLIDDFGREALKHIRKYDAFINVPSHLNYQPVIHNCLNQYSPLEHTPQEGSFTHIDYIMHHIFGEQYELGMDYMQILYNNPTQILPILCLVSSERSTGKTTFLDMCRIVFGENTILISNKDIESDFNGYMAGKLLVGIDETALNNQKVTEMIKMYSTAKEININRKGKDLETIANFAKFIMCSNNETRFIYTESEEVRFWIRKVAPIPAEDYEPQILKYIEDEADAFLYHLCHRTMFVKEQQHRMWFTPEMIATDALRALNLAQRRSDEKALYEWVRDFFIESGLKQFYISKDIIRQAVPFETKVSSERIEEIMLKLYGKMKYDTKPNRAGVEKPNFFMRLRKFYGKGENEFVEYKSKGRGWKLVAEKCMTKEEYADYKLNNPYLKDEDVIDD